MPSRSSHPAWGLLCNPSLLPCTASGPNSKALWQGKTIPEVPVTLRGHPEPGGSLRKDPDSQTPTLLLAFHFQSSQPPSPIVTSEKAGSGVEWHQGNTTTEGQTGTRPRDPELRTLGTMLRGEQEWQPWRTRLRPHLVQSFCLLHAPTLCSFEQRKGFPESSSWQIKKSALRKNKYWILTICMLTC